VVENGQAAVDAVLRASPPFDCILMGRGLHSSTFWSEVGTFCGIGWDVSQCHVTIMAQVEMMSERVEGPTPRLQHAGARRVGGHA
jgi:hypothetical protein